MRFRSLLVRSYRAIDSAKVAFGPGLNVLYGPNDLGKTTLASAMRAALLLPADSTAHQAFLPWHSGEPPRVCLSFERGGTVFRVSKSFGHGSLGSARLESSADGLSYQEEERGRAVDRRLREVLRWGIDAPGGKGAARGLPESFLSHVLLAAQAGVPEILERTLGGDRDVSGREQLHEALQALAQDPVFKRVLTEAQAKVDMAFTPTGRRKTGQSSPFAPLKERINALVEELERLTHQRRQSDEVQQRIRQLGEERASAEAELAGLEERVARQQRALEQLGAQQLVRERWASAQRTLEERRAAVADLERLEVELAEAARGAEQAAERVAVAMSVCLEAEAALAAADQALSALTGEATLERQARERAALDFECSERRGELARVQELLELEQAVAAAQATWQAELDVSRQAERELASLRRQLASLDEELASTRRLQAAGHYREANGAVERARAARSEAEQLESRLSELRERVDRESAARPPLPEVSAALLGELRQLQGRILVTSAQLEVGLSLALKLPEGTRYSVASDGGPELAQVGTDTPQLTRARGRARARLPGAVELEVSAGDPELRVDLERLEARWRQEAVPLLEAAAVGDLDALHERLEAERARAREVATWRRDADALELRAAAKRELGVELELWQRRAEERRRGLGDDLLALSRELEPLGDDWEACLQRRLSTALTLRARLQSELEAHATRGAHITARLGALAGARDAAVAGRDRARWVKGPDGAPAPLGLPELRQHAAALAQAAALALERLEAWERALASESAAAQRARELAGARLAQARAQHDAAQTESFAAKERHVSLMAQLRERKRHGEALDLEAARAELERARAEVEALVPVEAISPDELAQSQQLLLRAVARLDEVLAELRRAEGALGHVGGHVVVERERQTEEALEHARALEIDQEREYAAYRLLTETLRSVEDEQGAHLGRALEAPVSERFEHLTLGRYKAVGIDAGLGLQGVLVAGQQRRYRELSEGTQEQLATILRLCIAEHLDAALVLDDHLAQTHRQRAEWFKSTLRGAAERIQIIVLTARPEDYLGAGEMCEAEALRDSRGGLVRAIDLERVIERASYA